MNQQLAEKAKSDPATFARLFLGFEPDPWQENFLRSTSKRIILNCSRQSGKSTVTAILALWEAIYKPKSVVLINSKSLRQSSELMLKFNEFRSKIDSSLNLDQDTRLSVRFSNGSRVIALPGSEGTIRGISAVTLLILDEASRIPDDFYGAVRPMLAVSGGRIILLSTPFGEQGFFFDTWIKSEGWQKFEIPWTLCKRISPEFIEEERRERSGAWVAQEYECKFIAAGATRIRREWLKYEDHAPAGFHPGNLSPGYQIAMGVDLAISEKATADYTAACILGRDTDGNLHVLDIDRTRASFSEQIKFIKRLADKWQPSIVGVEDVQYQKVMVQQISAQTSLNVRGIRPDRDKVSRFAPLEGRYELGQIYHVRDLDQAFESELLSFPMGAHDDMVDAMSIAFAALDDGPVDCGWGVSRLRGRRS